MRFSLCCGREGCRRRILPPSVRFWNRKVYWAPVVLLAATLRQRQPAAVTLQRLAALCGVWRSTVKRWQRYFRDHFPKSIGYLRLSGRLMPPIDAAHLPGALLARFYQSGGDPEAALISCLQALALGP